MNSSLSSLTRKLTTGSLLLLWAGLTATQLGIGQPLSGTIFTTTAACATVRVTQFENKSDVFVQSGPDERGNGLPPGSYFVQVTDPGGFLLGVPRTSVNVGEQGFCAQLESLTLKVSNGLSGFDDTPNPGGEYKVWVSPHPAFPPSESKTANFKVRPKGTISGQVFYDADTNGLPSGGLEKGIRGWKLILSGPMTTISFTDELGQFRFEKLPPGVYRLKAVPPPSDRWVNTVPAERMVSVKAGETALSNDFAFVCLGAGGALPREFWTSPQALELLQLTDAAFLNTRPPFARFTPYPNLPPGATPFDTKDLEIFRAQVKGFLENANGADPRYLLAAELLVLELNVLRGLIVPSMLVYAPGLGFLNILPGLESRAIQAWLSASYAANMQISAILAGANANQSFVQPAACAFSSPY